MNCPKYRFQYFDIGRQFGLLVPYRNSAKAYSIYDNSVKKYKMFMDEFLELKLIKNWKDCSEYKHINT